MSEKDSTIKQKSKIFESKIFWWAIGLGSGLGFYTENIHSIYSSGIPNQDQVQQGYVAPSRMSVYCKDLDNNGELETILKVDDKEYLVKEDSSGVALYNYMIEPPKVVVED